MTLQKPVFFLAVLLPNAFSKSLHSNVPKFLLNVKLLADSAHEVRVTNVSKVFGTAADSDCCLHPSFPQPSSVSSGCKERITISRGEKGDRASHGAEGEGE